LCHYKPAPVPFFPIILIFPSISRALTSLSRSPIALSPWDTLRHGRGRFTIPTTARYSRLVCLSLESSIAAVIAWLVMPILSSVSPRSLFPPPGSVYVGLIAVYCIASDVLFQSFSRQFALRLLPSFSPSSRLPSLSAFRLIHAADPLVIDGGSSNLSCIDAEASIVAAREGPIRTRHPSLAYR
jgi:hypothetical protein